MNCVIKNCCIFTAVVYLYNLSGFDAFVFLIGACQFELHWRHTMQCLPFVIQDIINISNTKK